MKRLHIQRVMFWILTPICTPSFNAPPIMAMNVSKKKHGQIFQVIGIIFLILQHQAGDFNVSFHSLALCSLTERLSLFHSKYLPLETINILWVFRSNLNILFHAITLSSSFFVGKSNTSPHCLFDTRSFLRSHP